MPLTKSGARTKVRQRIRDTVATYEYSDTLLDSYLAPALREVAVAVRAVDPDYYLRSAVVRGYTDALDPGDEGTYSYEFYRLPAPFSSLRWCERYDDGVVQYRIREVSARDQEMHRAAPLPFGNQIAVVNGGSTDTYTVSPYGGSETISVHGDRFRIVPPPVEEGAEWRLWFDAQPVDPVGESEPLEIPAAFEEALIRAWAFAVLDDEGDEKLAAAHARARDREIAKGQAAHRNRTRRSLTLGRGF